MNCGAGYGMEALQVSPVWYVERVQKIISHNVLHDYTRDYIV